MESNSISTDTYNVKLFIGIRNRTIRFEVDNDTGWNAGKFNRSSIKSKYFYNS